MPLQVMEWQRKEQNGSKQEKMPNGWEGFLFLGMYFLLEVIMTTIKLQNWKKRIKNCQKR